MQKIYSVVFVSLLVTWILPSQLKTEVITQTTDPVVDGPYVLYREGSIIINYLDSADGKLSLRSSQMKQSQKDQVELDVQTDEPGKTFKVKLQPKLSPEKNSWNRAKKMLVLSDIEGEFAAFRKLLQGNGVIDENYKWTFGDGHLVLVGDFVDRGTMVTEVLWLIYSLESQAEASGGKVHYVLGNHEIMNMSGDFNYVQPRYMNHAKAMGVPYLDLFGKNAELGRWLATKNVMERIGNVLFMHGGISSYMNTAQMPLDFINDSARTYYTDTSFNYPSVYSDLLFSEYGPFWYRGYYYGQRATEVQVDSTLNIYNSRYIVTGHTVVAHEIVSVYNGRIIDTDVHHKGGYSEALLIEGNKMYRVNAKGEQMKINPLK